MADFTPKMFQFSGAPQSNAGSAAGNVNLGNTYGALRKNAPRFDDIGATAIANRAQERATVMAVEGELAAAGVSAAGTVKSNKLIAEAQEDAAQAQAQGSMMGSALDAIGSSGGDICRAPACHLA